MNISKYLIVLCILPLMAFSLHKYYISLCEIEYVKEQQSLQVTLNLFIDDLEFTLNKNHQIEMQLDTENEAKNADELFENYLRNNFKIKVNNESKNYDYIGKEYDDNLVRFYLEVTNIEQLNILDITNTSLTRDFKDQQNIIKIKVGNFHKSFYLNQKNANCLLNF